jgi:putative membrane protein
MMPGGVCCSAFRSTRRSGWLATISTGLVHLSFGLFAIRPFAEAARRFGGMERKAAILGGFLFVGAISALYEIFEWLLTIILAPGMADEYNGQQGDLWDSQKDMASALAGGLVVSLWMLAMLRKGARS